MEQQVAICHPIRIIQEFNKHTPENCFFHKLPMPFFNDEDRGGILMNAADTSLQEAAANNVSDLFIY